MSQPAPYRPVAVVAGPPTSISPRGGTAMSPGLFRGAEAVWWSACVLIPLCLVLEPLVGGPIFVPILISGLLLFPGSGVVLLAGLLMKPDRAHARTFLGAALGLGLCVALLGPAGRLGFELAFGSRQTELDRLAGEVSVAFARAERDPHPQLSAFEQVNITYWDRLSSLGLNTVSSIHEGLLFSTDSDPRSLLYAGGGSDPDAPACRNARAKFIGGHWFVWHCVDNARHPAADATVD